MIKINIQYRATWRNSLPRAGGGGRAAQKRSSCLGKEAADSDGPRKSQLRAGLCVYYYATA